MIRIQQLSLPLDYTRESLLAACAKELRLCADQILSVQIKKRSLDARKKSQIHYSVSADVEVLREKSVLKKCSGNKKISLAEEVLYRYPKAGEQKLEHRPVVIGTGPAGLFCGLLLARCGYRPILLERGACVEDRVADVEEFWRSGALNPESNVQFGEGGAGTFSDGKLNTMVNDREGRSRFVLETFVQAGASPEILYQNKPHIGTDVLREVVRSLRLEMLELGAEVRFHSCVTDLLIEDGQLRGVVINGSEVLPCEAAVAAIGHSARDTFAMLRRKAVPMEPKAFAVGVRVEHPQSMINRAQYGQENHPLLPAADYKLTGKLRDGRGVYSFCMCPGGHVVNASSEPGMLAVNGMSYQARDSRNANSAIVVTVTPKDFPSQDILGGVEFQRDLERRVFDCGRGRIPVQRFGDFQRAQNAAKNSAVMDGKAGQPPEKNRVSPCVCGLWQWADLRGALPEFLGDSLEEGIQMFDRTIPGFSMEDTLLLGVESRTSSPVRILRGENRMSEIQGLYPCGEGAGYAGGITSAAMDGMKTAEAIIGAYQKF